MKKPALKLTLQIILLMAAFYILGGKAYSQTIYVDAGASGANNGSSWANAFNHLQDALAAASSGEQIWVAAGTYYPDEGGGQTNNDREATFQLLDGVEIYGGFAGTESSGFNPDDRDFEANATTLNGDIDGDGEFTGNAYHVVTGSGSRATAVLDGFTITGGNANGGTLNDYGAGVFNIEASPTLRNLTISGNRARYGGGMYNFGVFNTASPKLTNVTFSGNRAGSDGGGMYNSGADDDSSVSPKLTNVTFSGNQAGGDGGGMYNEFINSLTLTNVIIWGNQAGGSSTTASASIFNFTSTPTISFSLIANSGGSGGSWNSNIGTDDGNNLDTDPLFIQPVNPDDTPTTAGDLSLMEGSPAIDAGSNDDYPGDLANDLDLAGNPRVFDFAGGGIIDMGAYEFQGEPDVEITPGGNNILYVDIDVSGGDGSGSSWANAVPELRDALGWASGNWDAGTGGTLQIWVAGGQYLPTGDDTDRTATFQLLDGVEIYGGFAGTETAVGQRDWEANIVTLNGDIDNSGTLAGNSYHVVTGTGTDATAALDGFTITSGNANSSGFPNHRGGGMRNGNGSPTLTNLIVSGNRANDGGGGMNNGNGSPTLTNVLFSDNHAVFVGGGMLNDGGALTMANVVFSSNTAEFGGGMLNNGGFPTLTNVAFFGNQAGNSGGGMRNNGGSPTLTNVTFSGNSADQSGGGMLINVGSPTLTNVTFVGNSAESDGGGMANFSNNNPTLTNVIIWNNQAGGSTTSSSASIFNLASGILIGHSLIANSGGSGSGWDPDIGTDSGNNIDADPLFLEPVDPGDAPTTAGDLSLTDGSPAIDMGDSNTDPLIFPTDENGDPVDLGGEPRFFNGGMIDMGAYEFQGDPGGQAPFSTTWQTDAASESITIPVSTVVGGYNYNVDWGDGATDTGLTGDATHTYAAAGTYTVSITGDFPAIQLGSPSSDDANDQKLVSIEQWGDIVWSSMLRAFQGATNLQGNATDTPDLSGVTDMSFMFQDASTFNQDLNDWDVSGVTDMFEMFGGATAFNGEIGDWEVGSVTNMGRMFFVASAFNQSLSGWNVSGVTDMSSMFEFATSFNGDISGWEVGSVTDMNRMFSEAAAFNQDIGEWDVASVSNMTFMFNAANSFNQDLGQWVVSGVTNTSRMFVAATAFNQDIGGWDVSSVSNMAEMFEGATAFNQNLGGWDVTNVNLMFEMLNGSGLSTENYDSTLIGWAGQDVQDDVPLGANNLTYCASQDERQSLIDDHGWTITGDVFVDDCLQAPFVTTWQVEAGDLDITIPTEGSGYDFAVDWGDGNSDTGVIGDITHTYDTPGAYEVEITGDFPRIFFNDEGDKEKILSVEQWGDIAWSSMASAFEGTVNLQGNAADAPDLSGVTDMSWMFAGASAFNGDIGGWDVSGVTDMLAMFAGASAFNGDIGGWDVSSVTTLFSMFFEASAFNQPIGDWDVSSVTDMNFTFANASAFDQDLGGWDVSSVTTMQSMFNGADAFNHPIGGWDVTSVENMSGMLNGSGLSAANYDATLTGWAGQDVQDDVPLGAEGLEYCAAADERQSLIDDHAWTITGDSFVDECLQTDLDLTLKLREGWRMLSSPIDGLTYSQMIDPLWTQGVPGSDYEGDSNTFQSVYTWDLTSPNTCLEGDPCPEWIVPPTGFGNPIPPGSGFLVYVFADDDFDGIVDPEEEAFSKTLTLSGIRYTGDISPQINDNPEGWTLVGNPYDQPVAFNLLERIQVNNAAYVYDANADPDAVPDDGPTNGNGGAWRSTVDGLYGDLTDGIIASGQGFFVQTTGGATNPSLTFSESDQTGGGEFYGKQAEPALSSLNKEGPRDYVRLEVQDESLYNSAWIRFSNNGSTERTKGEALELQPLGANYAMLAARKADGTLMDIAHYPLDEQDLEIPLAVEATQSGEFTIRATDLDLPAGMSLHLYDRQTGQSIPISNDSFEYSFTIDDHTISPYQGGTKGGVPHIQKQEDTSSSTQASRATVVVGPAKATTSGTDRFLITTTPGAPASELPNEVALGQNYPNPFNPSTVISYQLPAASQVRLEVYDMLGRQVGTLVDEQMAAGTHQVNFDASRLSSGVYLYRLTALGDSGSQQSFTKKLTLIK